MVSTNDSLISVRDLRKTYRSGLMGRKRHEALKGVSLEVGRGQVFGLLGPNGAGKTTMIKVLLGLIKNFEGDAMMFGRPVGPAELRQRVGYLPEAHLLPPYLTGRQVLELFGQFSGLTHSALRKLVPHWLDRVGVADSANRKVKEYSKGMKQRLGLAQALIHEPELVFLDEPTDGVDPVGRKEIRDIVEEARQGGATLFLNSHLLMEVQQMCDQIVILNNGKIQRSGSVEDMAKETEAVHFHLHTEAQINSQRLISDLGRDARWEGKALVIDIDDEKLQEAIDRLRAEGVSILGIERKHLTLEEAFIETVEDKQSSSAPRSSSGSGPPANDPPGAGSPSKANASEVTGGVDQ